MNELEFRSVFNKIFGHEPRQVNNTNTTRLEYLNDYQTVFSVRNDYSNDILLKTCFSTLAKHIAKLEPVIIQTKNNTKTPDKTNSLLNELLTLQPNSFMTSYDFYYKLAYSLIQNQNAYIKINRDRFNNPVSLWVLDYLSVETRELENEIYLKFSFKNGTSETISYSDIIHVRYDFGQGEFISHTDSNIEYNLALLDTLQQSFKNKCLNSGKIKGVAMIEGQAGADDWKATARELKNNMNDVTQGGIVTTDSSVTFTPVNSNPESADTEQLEFVRDNIYNFFGISKNIVAGKYTEQEWQSFFENTIEPISISLSQEFTRKLLTQEQRNQGYSICFSANRLTYTDTKTKVELIKELRPLGLLTTNQALELLNLPPVENGNDRVQTLNVCNTEIVNKYQLNKIKGGKSDDE